MAAAMDGRGGRGVWHGAAALVAAAGILAVALLNVLPHTEVRTVGDVTVEICTPTGIALAVLATDGTPLPPAGPLDHLFGCRLCVAKSGILAGTMGLAGALVVAGPAIGRGGRRRRAEP
jgi:hypothetical protein